MFMFRLIFFHSCASAMSGVLALTLLWQGPSFGRDLKMENTIPITQYANNKISEQVVILAAGEKQGIVGDSVFDVYRPAKKASGQSAAALQNDMWIKVGEVKAVEVHDGYSLAYVVEKSTAAGVTFFPKYPHVMAGDVVAPKEVAVNLTQVVMPEDQVSYYDVFVDPKAGPETFELTDAGKQKLKAMAQAFMNVRMPVIMVEGHTDAEGAADANQVESYQRALTVRQYLVGELGFDPARVVAIGFGEDELAQAGYAPGFRERNRRVVLKAIESL